MCALRFPSLPDCLLSNNRPTLSLSCIDRLQAFQLSHCQLLWHIHCPKSNPKFRDITWNVEENEIQHEIFRVLSRFPRYILCYIAEN